MKHIRFHQRTIPAPHGSSAVCTLPYALIPRIWRRSWRLRQRGWWIQVLQVQQVWSLCPRVQGGRRSVLQVPRHRPHRAELQPRRGHLLQLQRGGPYCEGLPQRWDQDLLQVRWHRPHLQGVPERYQGLVDPSDTTLAKVLRGTYKTGLLLWRVLNNLLSRSNLLFCLPTCRENLGKDKIIEIWGTEIDIRCRPFSCH